VTRTLWAIIALLIALWVAGLALRILGRVINVLLVVAVMLVVFNLLTRRD